MPYDDAIGDYLHQNFTIVGRLFNVQEQRDFLRKFVSQKKVKEFLSVEKTNSENVKKIINFIQYKSHDDFYDGLIDQLVRNHQENVEFIKGMMKKRDQIVDSDAADRKRTIIMDEKNKTLKLDQEIFHFLKEAMFDIHRLCQEIESKINTTTTTSAAAAAAQEETSSGSSATAAADGVRKIRFHAQTKNRQSIDEVQLKSEVKEFLDISKTELSNNLSSVNILMPGINNILQELKNMRKSLKENEIKMKLSQNKKPSPAFPLTLDPAEKIVFQGPFTRDVTSHLKLINSSEKSQYFKIKTTAPENYYVKLGCGCIKGQETIDIAVILKKFEFQPNEKYQDKIMVECLQVKNDNGDDQNKRNEDENVDFIGNLFRNAPIAEKTNSKVSCIFQLQ